MAVVRHDVSVLVTGASSGIGAALSAAAARRGARRLFLLGRDAARLDETAARCRREATAPDFRCDTLSVDVTDAEALRRAICACDAETPLDVVFANAGIATGREDEANTRRTFATNALGVLNTAFPALDCFARHPERSRRQLVLTASIAGYAPLAACPAYAGTKAFVKSWGLSTRARLARSGIRVNVVCPGFVRSRITDANTCPMPFFMEADAAAERIWRGVDRNVGLIAFPAPMRLAVWLLSILPWRLAEFFSAHLPEKTWKLEDAARIRDPRERAHPMKQTERPA